MFTQVQACRLWPKAKLPFFAWAQWLLSPFALTCVALSQQTSASSTPAGQGQVQAHSDVVYSDGLLTVVAGDTSLNSLIHEIGNKAGIKITGRAADDPVFGHYGPEKPEVILTTLLDGSGSNILLVHDGTNHTTELVLTPRTGGPTPPNPAAQFASENTSQPAPQYQQPNPVQQGQQQRPPYGGSRGPGRTGVGGIEQNPAATAPSSTSEQVVFPPIDGTTPAASATTTPLTTDTSTGTAKTPQQIFEQLQKLRQQQSQTNQSTPQ